MSEGCQKAGAPDDKPEGSKELVFDYNMVKIESVSAPDGNLLRSITVLFSDKEGNSLRMTAGSTFKSLEAGWYKITSKVDRRLDAVLEMTAGETPVKITGGTVIVSKKNYEYRFLFNLESDKDKITASAKNKMLYFESETYSSLSKGAEGNFLKDQKFRSEILGYEMKYSIYLPEGYDTSKKYPILYILHGMDGNNNDWLKDNTGGIYDGGGTMPAYAREFAEQTGKELIIVSPEGQNMFYCDGYEHGRNYMSYFFQEFVPFIESTYSVKTERSSRAIGGLSMGGYGSLYYGLLHPEMFCHVYACSAAVSAAQGCPDPAQMIAEAANKDKLKELPGFTLEIGTEDFLFTNNETFVRTLDDYNVPYEYITRSGAHTWPFWNACSPKIIRKVCSIFE